ncbi:MAG: peptide ABC transporter substrate-binding protein [Bacillota bacterium]
MARPSPPSISPITFCRGWIRKWVRLNGAFYESIPIKNAAAFNKGLVDRDAVGVKVLNDKTLEITLEYAVATFDGAFTAYPLREEFVKAKGEALGGTPDDLEYSGPYILAEWVYDSHMVFEKNPNYIFADSSFPIDTLKLLVVPDANTRVAMFQAGEADIITSVSSEYLDTLEEYLIPYSAGNMLALQFNRYGKGGNAETARVMQNRNFRLALSYALDREAIISAAMPTSVPINRLVLDYFPDASGDDTFIDSYPVNTVPMNGDADKAKEYLQAALEELGYSSASQLPTISYLSFSAPNYKVLAETLVDQWKQVLGLECFEINLLAVPMAIQTMMNYDYDIYLQSLGAGSDPSEVLAYFKTGGSINDLTGTGRNIFSDEDYDNLISQAQVNFDKEERYQLLAQAEQIILDSGVLAPLCSGRGFAAVQPYVEGYIDNPLDDGFTFNQLTISKKK